MFNVMLNVSPISAPRKLFAAPHVLKPAGRFRPAGVTHPHVASRLQATGAASRSRSVAFTTAATHAASAKPASPPSCYRSSSAFRTSTGPSSRSSRSSHRPLGSPAPSTASSAVPAGGGPSWGPRA